MPDATRRDVLVTEALLVVMSVMWGMNFVVMKYGTDMIDAFAYNGVRVTIGALVMLTILWSRRAPRLPWRDVRSLMLLGLLGTGVYQLFFISGLARTRAGTASLVIASSPAMIAIVGRVMGFEKVSRRAVIGIVIAFAGIAFVILSSADSNEGQPSTIGDLLVLAAVVCWAFYAHLVRPFAQRIDGIQVATWVLVGGTAPIVLAGIPSIMRTNWHMVAPLTWGAILYSGIISMGIAYLFWYRGARVIGPTRTSAFANLQPLVALAASWPMLGEKPTLIQGVGAGAVLGGLLLTRQPSAPEPAHGE
ncbi:MAG: DMT family transporter [Gemmatimonadaceae bacterium]